MSYKADDELTRITLSYGGAYSSIITDIRRAAYRYESRTGSPATHIALGPRALQSLKYHVHPSDVDIDGSQTMRVMGLQIVRVLAPPDFIGICEVLDSGNSS